MPFPMFFLLPDNSVKAFHHPADFIYTGTDSDAIAYPAQVWMLWSPADWSSACPEWRPLVLIDEPPAVGADQILERKGEADWTLDAEALTLSITYTVKPKPADLLASELEAVRSTKVRAIQAERDRRLGLGALHGGKRFSNSDASRTDLGGMATTAGLVAMGALSAWPDSYAQGWIAIDNTRLPLPTPADGIALAAAVALSYSATVQHARDLKDAALSAADPAAVNELAGWPD
ncbi:hypothetical protein EI613_18765 [Azospirillum sp. 412522]|nr:hypothetical protein [Azospirillum sp. 412522]MBY6263945.1 hypothetical protein [Azospirillum sp. 412522]